MRRKILALNGSKSYTPIAIFMDESNDNQFISIPRDIADILARTFANNSSNANYLNSFLKLKADQEQKVTLNFVIDDQETAEYNNLFAVSELRNCLILLVKNTAPGPDNIPTALIEHLPENIRLFSYICITEYEQNEPSPPSGLLQ